VDHFPFNHQYFLLSVSLFGVIADPAGPVWKKTILQKKELSKAEEDAKKAAEAIEEAKRWEGIPDWKKKVILEKVSKSSAFAH
jgi:hypothetical protein